MYIRSLNPANGFSWGLINGPDYNFFGGVITDNRVKGVNVLQNEKVHKSNIFEVDDNVRVWYSIFDYETKSTLDKPDKIKIEALDEEDVILSEETFDGT